MRTDIIYGYGVGGDILSKISEEKIKAYVYKYDPDLYKEIIEEMSPDWTFTDVAKNFSEDSSYGDRSVWTLLAELLSRKTGITFEYHIGSEGKGGFMFPETMPWCYSEKEKNITPEEIDDILQEFCKELGYTGVVNPDSISIEYTTLLKR